MSSTCEKLQTFADGELAVTERPSFHRHLATCKACQDGLESALMLDALAASLSDERAGARCESPSPAVPAALPPPPR